MAELARNLPTDAPREAAAPAAPKERWTQWVALTTTVLAVCAAISSLKGGGYSTKVQLATTQEANAWSYFQSKSIKQHQVALHLEQLELLQLEARTPEAKQHAGAHIDRARDEIARYEKEKEEAQAHAKAVQTEELLFKQHGAPFGLAVMLLQIAIMLSSVGALIKRPVMWGVGLALGAAGLVYMADGFWLFVHLPGM